MKRILLLLVLLLSSTCLLAQGTNNKQQLDSVDIIQVFDMLGIQVFKFPIQNTDSNYRIEISFAEYQNQKLISEIKLNDLIPKLFSDPIFSVDSSKSNLIRFYCHENSDSTYQILTKLSTINIPVDYIYAKDSLGLHNWRAFNKTKISPGKKTPVLLRDAIGKDEKMLQCPSYRNDKQLIDFYKYCLIIYIELVKK